MAYKTPQHSAARALSRDQHWVIARLQLLALGYSTEAIKHRVRRGRLHPILRGVYSVDRPAPTRDGWYMGAVLACGSGAALSHASAAALWGFRPAGGGAIHVSVPRDRRHPRIA